MNILNKFKRGLAGLLSLSVAVSAVFVFHFPLVKAHADDDGHTHIGWTEWTETDRLPTEPGNYYLTYDVTLQSGEDNDIESWAPKNGTYLCLNGHQIIMADNDKYVITVKSGVCFDLYNCEDEGYILHATNVSGGGVCVERDGTFNMHGGAIDGNTAENGGGVYNNGEFNMYGGDITRNYAEGDNDDGRYNGGGVYNNGEFNMYGGDISGNEVNGSGGGVYDNGKFTMLGGTIGDNTARGGDNSQGVYAGGKFIVGGTATVADGGNVYLPSGQVITISSEKPLWGEETKIWVTTENQPTEASDEAAAEDVVIAKMSSANDERNYRKFFGSFDGINLYDEFSAIYDKETKTIKLSTTTLDPEIKDDAIEPEDSEPNTSEPGDSNSSSDSSDSSESSNSESSDSGDSSTTDSSDSNSSEESGNSGNEPTNPTHSHVPDDGITWTAFDKENPQTVKGNYFLAGEGNEVELNETWVPADGTRLCLGGKKLTINNNAPVISVTGEFTLCDNEGGGSIAHDTEHSGVGVSVASTGKFAIYGGTIDGNNGNGVTIEGNGVLTVGGTAKILDEVYLRDNQYITIDESEYKHLTDGAEIYVKTESAPTAADGETAAVNIPITYANKNGDYSEFFHSKNPNYTFINETTTDGDVVFLAVKTEENQKHEHGGVELTEWTATDRLPEEAGNYYLAGDVTLTSAWTPKAGTHLCLNGKTINGTISAINSGVTLYNCKSPGTANVTVTACETITVGGKLKANITLNKDAKIDVDSNYRLTTGASITVTLAEPLTEGGSAAITTANGGAYSVYFKSEDPSYTKKIVGTAVVFEKPEKQDPPITGHTNHPVCGDIKCGQHSAAEWTEWTGSATLPSAEGSYYLTRDVTLTSPWKPTNDINLCLNGYTITMNYNDTAVYVTEDLSICDCDSRMRGVITHASGKTGKGVYIAAKGALTMYGGNIKGNTTSADGAGVYNDGVFDMLGGEITDNKSTSGSGGGLYNKGIAHIEGSINKNSASKRGGGVYQDGKLTVDEGAYIMYNTVGSSKSNVYLTDGSRIIIGSKFNGEVGVTLQTNPKGTDSETFANGTISSSTVNKIKSDSSSYKIVKSGDKLTLTKKSTTTGTDDSDYELEISSPLASSDIPSTDRNAIINLLKDMPTWVVGTYYDVTLWEDDEEIDDAGESLTVKLTIPLSIRATNREYKVIRVHDGEARVLDGTTDSSKTTITVKSRYFSTYAIIYSAVQNSGVGSSGTSSNGGYGNPAMGVQNEIPLAALACGFTVMALAAPGKKLDQ